MSLIKRENKAGTMLSLGAARKVCGYEIKKMPIGAYLRALETVGALPGDFMESCFPGKTLADIFDEMANAGRGRVAEMIAGIALAAPKYAVSVISELTGIPAAELECDPAIGFDGLVDIIAAVIEVNRLGEALSGAKALLKQAGPAPAPNIGCKE